MEPSSTEGILQVIRDWWLPISAMIAFIAGFVRLKVKYDSLEKRVDMQDDRVGRLEDRLDDNLKEIRGDVKELLKRTG